MKTRSLSLSMIYLCAIFILGGCATKVPLSDARYSGSAIVTSNDSVSVTATSFSPTAPTTTTMAASGGIYVPVSVTANEKFLFGPADQQELAHILGSELVRLNIFHSSEPQSRSDVKIHLTFKSSVYSQAINQYALMIEMNILDSNGRAFSKTYDVDSNEGATTWQKLNTSVWQGKKQAVQAALEKLVPDIQLFLRQ